MTTVIFSDTHLTDKFEVKKFLFLKKMINSADRVIINGDFWEGYITTFDKFIKSRWNQLFSLLRSKKAVYIYGNHDKKTMSDSRVNLFSEVQAEKIKIKVGRWKCLVEHGDRISPSGDAKYSWFPINKYSISIMLFFYQIMLYLFKERFLCWYHQSHLVQMKKWIKENLSKKTILICGHAHLPIIDLDSRFINTGFIRYGYGQYLTITSEKFELVKEFY